MNPSIVGDVISDYEVLQEKLDQLVAMGVDGNEIRQVLKPGAELIADRWRDLVPEPGPEHPYATGRYREGIKVAATQEFEDAEDGGIGWAVYTDVTDDEGFNYPEALEMGTSKMEAFPSAQPAFDESVEEVITMAEEALDRLITLKAGI